MMDKQKSVLAFKTFYIENILFRKNPNFFGQSNPEKIECSFSVSQTIPDQKKKQIQTTINVELFEEENLSESEHPFFLCLSITGIFAIEALEEKIDEETSYNLLTKNSVAILFPYVRSMVTNITASANIPNTLPVILPPINVIKMMEDSEAEN